ncbi:hypothetical protein [Streptomyces sp. ME18-1-4]|nr:hypothetical protein [Streptomyces sp. ME18-1-4]MDX3246501.1 hypothetical protein [Streptomyces sp. ME18-1-4]
MPRRGSAKWPHIHGSSPVADIDPATLYRKEASDDAGRTGSTSSSGRASS